MVTVVNTLTAWSYSRLATYRKCPRQAMYKFIMKIQVPEDSSPALERGNLVHLTLQNFVEGKVKAAAVKKIIGTEPYRLLKADLEMFKKSKSQCELELAVDKDWKPVSWFDRSAWLRAKLDVSVKIKDPKTGRVVDYKTGKIYSAAHTEQSEIYAAVAFAFQPLVEQLQVDMMYIDQGMTVPVLYTDLAKVIPRLRKKWEKESQPMFRDKTFKARPGTDCRWCPFSGVHKKGPCDKG